MGASIAPWVSPGCFLHITLGSVVSEDCSQVYLLLHIGLLVAASQGGHDIMLMACHLLWTMLEKQIKSPKMV